jgi:phosphoenolpyruvate carboxykinase (ATP)
LDGSLDNVPTHEDPILGLQIPDSCPNVPKNLLNPWEAWKNRDAYEQMARRLAQMFDKNFEQFADNVSAEVRNAGPRQS